MQQHKFTLVIYAVGMSNFDRVVQERGSHGTVTLSNAGTQAAHFCVVPQSSRQWWGQAQGQDTGLPDWLDIFPTSGVVLPQVDLASLVAVRLLCIPGKCLVRSPQKPVYKGSVGMQRRALLRLLVIQALDAYHSLW